MAELMFFWAVVNWSRFTYEFELERGCAPLTSVLLIVGEEPLTRRLRA